MLDTLATDLDGTLIPLENNHQCKKDLVRLADWLAAREWSLMFVTGRHLGSTEDAIETYGLPTPDWLIADVGTSIFQRHGDGFRRLTEYDNKLQDITHDLSDRNVRRELVTPELELQPEEQQGKFKLSFNTPAEELTAQARNIIGTIDQSNLPLRVVASTDPFTGIGLIDVLPQGVDKAYAISWLTENHLNKSLETLVYAGDSGNDSAVFYRGFRGILVANALDEVRKPIQSFHEEKGWNSRIYFSEAPSTSGVLEGCQHFAEAH